MASWALEGMEPGREMAEDIEAYIMGDVTIEELIEKSKLMSMPEAAGYRAAKLVDGGGHVSLDELLSEHDDLVSVHYVADKSGTGGQEPKRESVDDVTAQAHIDDAFGG